MSLVQSDEAKEFCKQHKLFFIETSALADSNVATAFETILKEIYRLISRKTVSPDAAPSSFTPGTSIVITEENTTHPTTPSEGKKCCG